MNSVQSFDSLRDDFAGINLIEAAAGTGKTYNIQNIVVRLLLEHPDLKIENMAVLSFTEEAAGELQNRIFAILKSALEICRLLCDDPDNPPNPASLSKIGRQALEILLAQKEADYTDFKTKLALAVRDFDDATITTINGFCSKILAENAFESGVLFNTVLETAPDQILKRCLNDLIRIFNHITGYRDFFNCSQVMELFNKFQDKKNPLLRNVQDFSLLLDPCPETPQNQAAAMAGLFDILFADAEKLPPIIGKIFSKGSFSDELLTFLVCDELPVILDSCGIDANNRKTLLELAAKFKDFRKTLPLYFHHQLRNDFEKLKHQENFMTYGDQITRVHSAVTAENSLLCQELRKKFKIGIIDEFQDTDAIQYQIFKNIFFEKADTGESRYFFLVGDPRQAIYSFRGGDLPAYLKAREFALLHGKIFYLTVNYRSCAEMVEAVNEIFGDAGHSDPFFHPELNFPHLSAAKDAVSGLVNRSDKPLTQFKRHRVPEKSQLLYCVQRIADMLSDDSPEFLPPDDKNPAPHRVTPDAITVLVPTHREAHAVFSALEKYEIPAVKEHCENIFSETVTHDVYTFLSAFVSPHDAAAVNAALSTPLSGMAPQILAQADSEEIAVAVKSINSFGEIWRQKGFSVMFDRFLDTFKVRETVAGLPDGKKNLTVLLQLQDILQQFSRESAFTPEALLNEFACHIAQVDKENLIEQFQRQRIDTQSAVRIMTFHAAKGLQFPIVMVPFVQIMPKQFSVVHDDQGRRIMVDESDPQMVKMACAEGLQEQLRLLYVALTRAVHCCEVFEEERLDIPDTAWHHLTSPLMRKAALPNKYFCDLPYRMRLVHSGAWTINSNVPQAPPEIPEIPDDYQMISYSSITASSSGAAAVEVLDHDDNDDTGQPDTDLSDSSTSRFTPFVLPQGENFGTAMHWIFENISFDAPLAEFHRLTSIAFGKFKLAPRSDESAAMVDGCAKWLHAICHTPLTDADGEKFTLSQIPAGDRICEMEFYCSISKFAVDDIKNAVDDYVRGKEVELLEWPENWHKEFSGGVLNGFIDVIFRFKGKYYIIDWKSHMMDGTSAGFTLPKLKNKMCQAMYFLQYLIYLVALVRHLRRFTGNSFTEAEYEKLVGNVYYMFIRGIAPDTPPDNGIFCARPPWETIEKLEQSLCISMN